MMMDSETLAERKRQGLYRTRRVIESAQGARVIIAGETYLNFSSNDYLGFANNQSLQDCMIEAIKQYGIGAASSQLLAGYLAPHAQLEHKLAQFLDREAALIFPTGYQANLALSSALITSNTVILQDRLNHASLLDAALLSKGRLVRYQHQDMAGLERLLEQYKQHSLLVMTDGVFSMDGDQALLVAMAELCKAYQACLVVDDAHGLGVLGDNGAGLLEKLGLGQDQVPVLIGTFGKAFGASGAFISGRALLIESLIQQARTYIYTTGLLPSLAMTMTAAIDLVQTEGQHLRARLNRLISYYKQQIQAAGFVPSCSQTPIQPLLLGEVDKTNAVSRALFEQKILATAIRPPTVPAGTSRLRISLHAHHTTEQIDCLVAALKQAI